MTWLSCKPHKAQEYLLALAMLIDRPPISTNRMLFSKPSSPVLTPKEQLLSQKQAKEEILKRDLGLSYWYPKVFSPGVVVRGYNP